MSELHKPERITWYKDEFTGNTMDKPGMQKLMQDLQEGKLNNIVCWRLDRLGRTAAGLTKLYLLTQVALVSMRSLVPFSMLFTRSIAEHPKSSSRQDP